MVNSQIEYFIDNGPVCLATIPDWISGLISIGIFLSFRVIVVILVIALVLLLPYLISSRFKKFIKSKGKLIKYVIALVVALFVFFSVSEFLYEEFFYDSFRYEREQRTGC